MKTLVNCKPSEFLKQTNRIRKSVEKWLTDTDIINIRKRMPKQDLKEVSEEEKKELIRAQVKENLSAMLDEIMDAHADETLELMALLCFVEPEHVDDYPITDYMKAVSEIISDATVISFFTSLVQLGQTGILS